MCLILYRFRDSELFVENGNPTCVNVNLYLAPMGAIHLCHWHKKTRDPLYCVCVIVSLAVLFQ